MGSSSSCLVLFCLLLLCGTLAFAAVPRCDANGKVKTTETKLDDGIRKFVWINNSKGGVEAIFILTRGRVVWRSVDEGKNFFRLDSVLPPPIDDIITTADSSKVYFLEWRGKLWTTENQGEDFKLATADLKIQSIRAHPTQANWALAQVISPGCFPSPGDGCSNDLYLTQDFGASWEKKASFVVEEQYDWGGAGLNGVPAGNVFYINFPDAPPKSNQYVLGQHRINQAFQRTPDLFRTHDPARPHAVAFKYFARTVVVAELISANDESLLNLFASHDEGHTYGQCNFPTSLNELSYHIADLSEGTAIISVDHGGYDWATSYVSDSMVNKFSTALNYTRRSRNGKSDFRRINALEGIYLANTYEITNEEDPITEDTPLVTVITMDKGGQWQKLSAPARDFNGQAPCAGCSLNLVPFSSSRRGAKAFYTKTDTPGVILATGSVSPWLVDREDSINAYLSRDGGMTWSQLAVGEHTYEMGDYGSLVLLSKTAVATSNILYTWDQGLSSTECAITDKLLDIKEIYNSPSGKDLSFVVYGTSGKDAYVIHVDFQNSDVRNCDSNVDYETWSPSDAHDDKCLLGQKTTYTRRKQDSKCYNPIDYETPAKSAQLCVCARQDFQCDYCYMPSKSEPGKCILDKNCPENPTAQPSPCNGSWNKTKGYRLVPGDKCKIEGSSGYPQYAPETLKCGSHGDGGGGDGGSGGGLSGGAIFGILVLVFFVLLAVVAIVGFVMYRVNPNFKEYVDANIPTNLFSFGGASKFSYTGSGSSHEYAKLNTSEPQSLLDDLEGDNALDDDLLEDEAPELDDKSISSFTNQDSKGSKGDDADSLI